MALDDLTARLELMVMQFGMLSLDHAAGAQSQLASTMPVDGPLVRAVHEVMQQGVTDGWLLPKEQGGVKFGRVSNDLGGFSVDAVLSSGAGPKHRHPRGEIDLLFAHEGEPVFDGHGPGWAVFPPGSEHVPAVTGGTMLILYFLPGGSIEWL